MSTKNKRCTNFMYVQQLKYLNLEIDELKERCINDVDVKDFAMIVHDKDLNIDKTQFAEKHLHLFITFKQHKSLKYVSELICDYENRIDFFNRETVPDKNERNGFMYLLHKTDGSAHKHQYAIDELIVDENSDIKEKIKKWDDNFKKRLNKKSVSGRKAVVKKYLEQYSEILIDYNTLAEKLNTYELAQNATLIKNIDSLRIDKLHQQYIDDERYKNKKIVWIYGVSGVGKSRLSKEIAFNFVEDNENIYVTQSNRDPFQNYTTENVIILEEFRATTGIDENELFQILDKTNSSFSAGSRYKDKKLMPDLVIINSIYPPTEILKTETIDMNQLIRRLDSVLHVDTKNIASQKFEDGQFYDFEVVKNHIYKPDLKTLETPLEQVLKGDFSV
ncbi:Rep family protein [Staphylococcus warneri]|uniref:Rep family protein n=1 Tax=Staphylococcus warneri TaxID=1292 RepID=UPI001CB9B5DA|nr:Rep family protein [Staphylococcus warneri]